MTEITEDKKIIEDTKANVLFNNWMSEDNFIKFVDNNEIKNCIDKCTSPATEDIFNAFDGLTPESTRVLILGQDPYPSGKGTGYAFLLNQTVTENDSLYYILKAIKSDFSPTEITNKQNVEEQYKAWAKENKVLLLNTALTHEKGNKTEHQNKWEYFIKLIIKNLLTTGDNKLVVFLWGDDARKLFHNVIFNKETDIINDISRNLFVLATSHPSKNYNAYKKGFCYEAPNHFKACNKFLGKNSVNWGNLLNIYAQNPKPS